MKNDKKYIYILTNKSFDNYIKVGFTDNVELKIKELNANASTPFPFKLYATYEVIDKSKAREVMNVLKDLNLCSEDIALNKKSDEMFISASSENVYVLFKAIAQIDNNENNVVRNRKQSKATIEVVGDEIVDKMIINDAIKQIMKKTGYKQREMSDVLGLKGANYVSATLNSKNLTTEIVLAYASVLGYDLVLKPKSSEHKADEIIITSSKKDN